MASDNKPKPSWHFPRLDIYNAQPPSKIVHVLFLQRLPDETREQILQKIRDCDSTWNHERRQDIPARELKAVKWIRDFPATAHAIRRLVQIHEQKFQQRLQKEPRPPGPYKSYILVGPEWESDECTAVTWQRSTNASEDSERALYSTRVPLSIASPLLDLIDSGAVNSLSEALDGQYDSGPLTFPPEVKDIPKHPPYRAPAFLPKGLSLSTSEKLVIISLRQLDGSTISGMKDRILAPGSARRDALDFYNWEGPGPTRQELLKLYGWLESNSVVGTDHIGYAFFVDNIFEGIEEGRLTLVAAMRHVDKNPERDVYENQMVLTPVADEGLLELWRSAGANISGRTTQPHEAVAEDSIEQRHLTDIRMEIVADLERPLVSNDDCRGLSFWYLRPFSVEEERKIRDNFAICGRGDEMHHYTFMGFPFTDGKHEHTMADLRDVWQKSDPHSPFFDPDHSSLRMVNYPRCFVALDDRVLHKKSRAILADGVFHSNNEVGWQHGTIEAATTYSAVINLWIANMDHEEFIEESEPEILWLGDMEAFATENAGKDEIDDALDEI